MDSRVVLAISGHGTCGKTTTSQYFLAQGLRYKYSTSEFAKKTIELPGDHKNRSQHRVAWGNAIANFNNEDGGIKLYKMMLSDHDILDGMRRVNELESIREWVQSQGDIFLSIWIDRDVPVDPSCEIRPEHCRFTINNRGSMMDLSNNIDIFWHGVNGLQ